MITPSEIKLCVIGCGAHTRVAHGPSLRACAAENPSLKLAACCDLNADTARLFAEKFGFAAHYDNIDTMLDAELPDALLVVLPASLTAKICEPLLARGIPLLVEKPPALTVADLERLCAAQAAGGARVTVGFNRRHTKLLSLARQLLDEHLPPAEVLRIDYEMVRANRRDRDFSITAVHAIDAIRFLAGSEYAEATFDYHELPHAGPGVADIVMNARCESGARIGLSVHPMAGVINERAAVHGLGRTLVLDLPMWGNRPLGRLRFWKDGVLLHDIPEESDTSTDVPVYIRGGFLAEHRTFWGAFAAGASAEPSLQACRHQVALMEAIETRAPRIVLKP